MQIVNAKYIDNYIIELEFDDHKKNHHQFPISTTQISQLLQVPGYRFI